MWMLTQQQEGSALQPWLVNLFKALEFFCLGIAAPTLTSYFSESSVVVLGSVHLYVKCYLCIVVRGRNPHYKGGRYKRAIIYCALCVANKGLGVVVALGRWSLDTSGR